MPCEATFTSKEVTTCIASACFHDTRKVREERHLDVNWMELVYNISVSVHTMDEKDTNIVDRYNAISAMSAGSGKRGQSNTE